MKKKYIYPVIITSILLLGIIVLFGKQISASTEEAIKLIQIKDNLYNAWEKINYLNSISEIVVGSDTNKWLSIISKFKNYIFLNKDLSFVSNVFYKDFKLDQEKWWNSNISIGGEYINWLNDYYNQNQIAPKDPTSILPISSPCWVYNMTSNGLTFKTWTNDYNSIGFYKDTKIKSNFSSFEKPGNILDWYLWLNIFISNKDISWVPTTIEITNENNSKGFVIWNVCNFNILGTWCVNGMNTFKIPTSTVMNWVWSIDWSNLDYIELYSSTWANINIWDEYFVLNSISYSDLSTPDNKIVINDFNNLNSSFLWTTLKTTLFYNCREYKTTDTTPLFVSFFENWNWTLEWGYTIVELRNKITWNYVNKFYIWTSKKWDEFIKPALNKSYTYWIYQQQDRSNLFITNGWGNLNLIDWIKTLSYNSLTLWSYSVYLQNINRFWFRSSNILVWYLNIIPPVNWLIFDFLNVENQTNWTIYNIINKEAYINFDKNIKININNPWNYDYSININWTITTKNSNYFTIESLPNWATPISISIKDNANNVIDTKTMVIIVDTVSPVIKSIWVNKGDYLWIKNSDWTYAMLENLWLVNVNDNIIWISKITPFIAQINDNLDSDLIIQYSLSNWWLFTNVNDITRNGTIYKFNIDTSFIANDWITTLYFRSLDKSWNISEIKVVTYVTNRSANFPEIITNNWNNFITNSEKVRLNFELENDIAYFVINWKKATDFVKFNNNYTIELPLVLWDNNFWFKVIDFLLNESSEKNIKITKTPTPTEGLVWKDNTINFKWWVRANSINLQRITPNGDPWEIFSR